MENIIIARYGEIHLKGNNRGLFLRALRANAVTAVGKLASVRLEGPRIVIYNYKRDDESYLVTRIANVFGVVSASPAVVVESKPESILKLISNMEIVGSFKAEVKRADKTFPYKSPEFAAMCGHAVLKHMGDKVKVDVTNPGTIVSIDIRENGKAYVYTKVSAGVGGMPVGTAGRALVMLSGGIDSPVAAWLAAKRGLAIDCVHFASPPYTSEFALDKVKRLVTKLSDYCGSIKLYVVPFTEIQEEIRARCKGEYMITIMRRFMVRIAEQLCLQNKDDVIITGENLAQVASQTVAGITSNNFCAKSKTILRPLITFDKSEIVSISKKIGTYEISIEPHADCCTVFVPRHPSINPNLKKVEAEENRLDVTALIEKALAATEAV